MQETKRRKQSINAGFTLIELMVVLAILAMLVAVIAPNVVGRSDDAKQSKAKTDVAMIESMLDLFYLDMGRYPGTEEGLRVLYSPPDDGAEKWKGPYPKKPIPKDPWGNLYIYESPGSHTAMTYEVSSLGKDGQEGGESYDADIVSWVEEGDEVY